MPKLAVSIDEVAELKQLKKVTELNTGHKTVSMAGTGHFHSIFVDQTRKKISSCGFNVRGQCGFSPAVDEIVPVPSIFRDLDNAFTKDEVVMEVMSGNSHNIIRTNKALYFVGNANHGQYEPELGNNVGLDSFTFQELDFSGIYDYKIENVEKIRCKFDKTVLYFKNGDTLLFGNLLLLNEEDALKYEIFRPETDGFRVKEFCPGLHCDLIAVEY